MILGLDIGNTSIVVGGLDESAIHFTAEFSTDLYKTSDEYAIMLKTVLEIHEIDRKGLEGAIIGTVVPALGEVLREAVRKVTGRKALLVGSGLKTGLNILIDSPAQAGSDLIVNALGALAQYPKPILIFDMGTATTLAVVNSKGNYVGGMIIPGVMLGMEALSNGTAQLPHISLEAPKKMIGTNTTDCMKSGRCIWERRLCWTALFPGRRKNWEKRLLWWLPAEWPLKSFPIVGAISFGMKI